ncbi:uncharacterized protein CIMG_12658 [Coccidioides immitis RS]|uniref:Uncharacterized protein n=1 Tax=Coccidioides immitis (strain RS) TaxID=246410 RepID=A0A0D8JUN6_COCIM|nr:uncharacterized protein CIMG_12658 [Coccidioides immitis RS]KJF59988.1 hypothetical protein CIMG_12658 [Coccidioides immitis RS]
MTKTGGSQWNALALAASGGGGRARGGFVRRRLRGDKPPLGLSALRTMLEVTVSSRAGNKSMNKNRVNGRNYAVSLNDASMMRSSIQTAGQFGGESLMRTGRTDGRLTGATPRDSYHFLILPAGGQSTADGDLIETNLPFFGARRQWGINAEPADALPEMKELGPFLVALNMGWFACCRGKSHNRRLVKTPVACAQALFDTDLSLSNGHRRVRLALAQRKRTGQRGTNGTAQSSPAPTVEERIRRHN